MILETYQQPSLRNIYTRRIRIIICISTKSDYEPTFEEKVVEKEEGNALDA